MDEIKKPNYTHWDTTRPSATEHEAGAATARLRRRASGWAGMAVVVAVSAGLAWIMGDEAAQRDELNDIEVAPGQVAPAAGFRMHSRTAEHNNEIIGMGLQADLDGTVILYPANVDGLVAPDGQFRTDLSPLRPPPSARSSRSRSRTDIPRPRSTLMPCCSRANRGADGEQQGQVPKLRREYELGSLLQRSRYSMNGSEKSSCLGRAI